MVRMIVLIEQQEADASRAPVKGDVNAQQCRYDNISSHLPQTNEDNNSVSGNSGHMLGEGPKQWIPKI